jgi:DNA replication protein
MDVMNMKSLIKKNIVDFSELVLNNYHKVGLDETDAVILIKLNYLQNRQITFIHPKKLANMLSISPATTAKRLNNLIERKYIVVSLIKNGNGKETESFSLDNLIEMIVKVDFEEKISEGTEENNNVVSRLVNVFETEFRKPLSILDIQTITKWLKEDEYTFDEINNALFDASKQRKLTIKYVDKILLSKEDQIEVEKYNQTTLIKDIKKIWLE